MPDPLIFCLFLFIALYLSVIIHEAGHALIGRALGLVVTSVGLGTARPFFIFRIGLTRLYLCRSQAMQGITFAFLPQTHPDRRRQAAFTFGGIAANALFAIAALPLARFLPTGNLAAFFGTFSLVNALMATISLIPTRYRVGRVFLRSDGRLLLDIFRCGNFSPPPADVIQITQEFRPHWQAVGDRLIERVYTFNAVLSWINLGSRAKAESLFAEALAIDAAHPYVDWLKEITRANLALVKGDSAEADAALTQAESCCESAGPEGRYLLASLRASLLHQEGRQGEASAAFESLSEDPVGRTSPELGLSALTAHLRVACAAGNQATIVSLHDQYEVARRNHPSDVRDLHVYSLLARFDSSRGDDARKNYRGAMEAMTSLAAPFRDAYDRAAFVDAQRSLIEEARLALGDEIAAPLVEAIETRRSEPANSLRPESLRRWAIRLMLVNLALFVPLMVVALAIAPRGLPIFLQAFFLAFFTLLGGIWLLIDFTLGRFVPSIKRLSGTILLILALIPWIGGLIGCAVWMMP